MGETTIRDAGEHDLPAIKAIYDREAAEGHATFDTEPRPVETWRTKVSAAGRGHHFLVAVDDTDGSAEVVGFASSSTYRPRPAYEATREVSVYLAPRGQRRGVGRALYDELLGRLREDGTHVALAVIATPNPGSEALHRACGFERVGVLPEVGFKHGRWIDTAFWALRLDPP